MTWGAAALDANDDGWTDLYVALGSDPAAPGVRGHDEPAAAQHRARALQGRDRSAAAPPTPPTPSASPSATPTATARRTSSWVTTATGYRLYLGTGGGAAAGHRLVVRLQGAGAGEPRRGRCADRGRPQRRSSARPRGRAGRHARRQRRPRLPDGDRRGDRDRQPQRPVAGRASRPSTTFRSTARSAGPTRPSPRSGRCPRSLHRDSSRLPIGLPGRRRVHRSSRGTPADPTGRHAVGVSGQEAHPGREPGEGGGRVICPVGRVVGGGFSESAYDVHTTDSRPSRLNGISETTARQHRSGLFRRTCASDVAHAANLQGSGSLASLRVTAHAPGGR